MYEKGCSMKHLTPLSMTRLSCSLRAKPPCSSHAHRFSSVWVHWNLLRCDFWRKGFYLHYRVFISDGNRTSWHTFLPFPLPERLHQVFLLKFLFYLIHKSLSQNFHWMKRIKSAIWFSITDNKSSCVLLNLQ